MNMNMSRPSMLWLYGLIGAFIIGYYVFGDVNDTPVSSDWTTVEQMVEKGEVEKILIVNRDQAQVFLKKEAIAQYRRDTVDERFRRLPETGVQLLFTIGSVDSFREDLKVAEQQSGQVVPVAYKNETNDWTNVLINLLPWVVIIGAWFFIMRSMSRGAGGGAGGGPGGAMILPIANADGLRFMDGFSIHPYMSPGYDPDFGYSAKGSPIPRVSVPHFMEHLHRNFSRRKKRPDGISPKLYVTEVGWYVQHPGERQATCTELVQAAYFARLYLLGRAASNGAVPIYWYDFQNDGTDPLEREHNFGLIRWDFSPKPAYQAAAVVASMLQNRPFVKAIRDNVTVSPADRNRDLLRSGIVKLYLYGQDNDRMLAAWTAQAIRRYGTGNAKSRSRFRSLTKAQHSPTGAGRTFRCLKNSTATALNWNWISCRNTSHKNKKENP